MQYIYFGAVFAATIIFLLVGLLLFMQRKNGERSRTILAGMSFLSVLNYVGMIVCFYIDPSYNSESIMDVSFLLLGIFVIIIYVIYPIEVISPGWITWKRLVKMYLPVMGLWLFYRLTLCLGVEYSSYETLGEMAEDIWSFQLIFRMVLALLIFLPALLLYYLPYTRRYNNTDHKWMCGYIAAVTINMAGYLYVNVNDTFLVCSLYIAVSILCSLYIAYQELYVRLIRCPRDLLLSEETLCELPGNTETKSDTDTAVSADLRRTLLFDRLEKYMNTTQAWRNPDLSVIELTRELYTNRNSLREAIQHQDYSSYTSYVNGKRIEDFIQTIRQQGGGFNYLETFFDVGFRSKSTAFRNFKEITGMAPSDYFQEQAKKTENSLSERS